MPMAAGLPKPVDEQGWGRPVVRPTERIGRTGRSRCNPPASNVSYIGATVQHSQRQTIRGESLPYFPVTTKAEFLLASGEIRMPGTCRWASWNVSYKAVSTVCALHWL